MKKETKTQKLKSKFRATSKWKKFRKKLGDERKVDFVTEKPLRKGWQLHHLNLDEKQYEDITDEEKFCCLNKSTHDIVHTLWRYYQKDSKVLDRLKILMDKMKDIN